MTSASKDKPEKQKDKDANVSGPHSTFLAWPAEVNDKKDIPFIVLENISQQEYEKVLSRLEKQEEKAASRFRRFARWEANAVMIVDLSLRLHEKTAARLVGQIINTQTVQGIPFANQFDSTGNSKPDGSLIPRDKPNPGPNNAGAADEQGNAFPNLIVEVGVSEQPYLLRRQPARWLSNTTTVQIVVTVYVQTYARGGTRMLAEVFTRAQPNNPVQSIEFGTASRTWNSGVQVTAVNQAFLNLPLALLYYGTPGGIPNAWGTAANLSLDLYTLQQAILAN